MKLLFIFSSVTMDEEDHSDYSPFAQALLRVLGEEKENTESDLTHPIMPPPAFASSATLMTPSAPLVTSSSQLVVTPSFPLVNPSAPLVWSAPAPTAEPSASLRKLTTQRGGVALMYKGYTFYKKET